MGHKRKRKSITMGKGGMRLSPGYAYRWIGTGSPLEAPDAAAVAGWQLEPLDERAMRGIYTGQRLSIAGVAHLVFLDSSLRFWAQMISVVTRGGRRLS